MSCRAYWLTTKVNSPQKEDLNLNQPLPDDWCRLISQNHIMPALFDHDFGGNSGTEMSIYTLVVQVETDTGLQMDKHQVHPLSLLPPKS